MFVLYVTKKVAIDLVHRRTEKQMYKRFEKAYSSNGDHKDSEHEENEESEEEEDTMLEF